MFSAHFEEALLTASMEELRTFFAELPRPARRRLLSVLADVDSADAQHFVGTRNPDADVDLAELDWPSEPDTQPVRQPSPAPSSGGSLACLFSLPTVPCSGLCLISARTVLPRFRLFQFKPLRLQALTQHTCTCSRLRLLSVRLPLRLRLPAPSLLPVRQPARPPRVPHSWVRRPRRVPFGHLRPCLLRLTCAPV